MAVDWETFLERLKRNWEEMNKNIEELKIYNEKLKKILMCEPVKGEVCRREELEEKEVECYELEEEENEVHKSEEDGVKMDESKREMEKIEYGRSVKETVNDQRIEAKKIVEIQQAIKEGIEIQGNREKPTRLKQTAHRKKKGVRRHRFWGWGRVAEPGKQCLLGVAEKKEYQRYLWSVNMSQRRMKKRNRRRRRKHKYKRTNKGPKTKSKTWSSWSKAIRRCCWQIKKDDRKEKWLMNLGKKIRGHHRRRSWPKKSNCVRSKAI